MRVIFDRPAFHADRFAVIEGSALRALQKQKRIQVFHTPIFLDETISSYGAGAKANQWQQHLLFCLDVCNGIFLERDRIWHNELAAGRGPFARFLLPERANKNYDSLPRLIETLRGKAVSGDISKEWAQSAALKQENQVKKNKAPLTLRWSTAANHSSAQSWRPRVVRSAQALAQARG